MASRYVAGALAALALASAVAAIWPSPRPAAGAHAAPKAPVLDAARLPAFMSDSVAGVRLAQRLDAVVAGRDQSCLTAEDDRGSRLYSRRPSLPLVPASNNKLLTASAVLDRIGEGERLRTELRAQRPAANGVVSGDVWLVGAGDPLLATAPFAAQAGYQHQPRGLTSLEDLAAKVVASGTRQIQGRVLGDESRYDTQRAVPTWSPTYASTFEVGPLSALTVNDNFAEWTPRMVPAAAPAKNAAAVLARLLQERGVQVGGDGEGRAPAGSSTIAAVESAPVGEVVGQMLTQSENLAAELLVKELGHRFAGAGTTAAGLGVVRDALGRLGFPLEGLTMVDGSGLDRSDRATCELLLQAVRRSGPSGTIARGLPVAGSTGTLFRRLGGTGTAGRVRAKTGSLTGASSFSGWAAAGRGRQVAFSLIVNGIGSEAEGHMLQDRLAAALVAYPEAPPPASLMGAT